jgi:hypothetical protein
LTPGFFAWVRIGCGIGGSKETCDDDPG